VSPPDAGASRAAQLRREVGYVLRFLVVGVMNTMVGLGTIYACKYFLGLGDVPANAVGYTLGLINSFLWNRRWTFAQAGRTHVTILRFALVFLVAYGANLITMMVLRGPMGIDAYIAHALATAPYTVIFYVGSRYFVFESGRKT
jgi:putative flippase GtrA